MARMNGDVIVLNEKEAATMRERARAAERNEKTDSVTKERRRIRDLEAEVQELREWKAERIREDEETKPDREKLAGLLDRLAEFVGEHGGALEYGEGMSWTIVTDEDLLRITELLDPDD